jgi:hypothetical protein
MRTQKIECQSEPHINPIGKMSQGSPTPLSVQEAVRAAAEFLEGEGQDNDRTEMDVCPRTILKRFINDGMEE